MRPEAVSDQRGKDPPGEGPSHPGSKWPPPGETRPAKRHVEASKGGEQVRGPQRQVKPAASSAVTGKPEQGGAEPRQIGRRPGKASKSLEVQRRRTSRRRGRGTWTRSLGELERPYRARRRRAAVGAGGRISAQTRSRSSARRESEGVVVPLMAVHENAAGGKAPLLRCVRSEQVSVGECR